MEHSTACFLVSFLFCGFSQAKAFTSTLIPWPASVPTQAIDESTGVTQESGEKLTGSAKSLCIPFDQPDLPEGTVCVGCGSKAINWTLFGRSY